MLDRINPRVKDIHVPGIRVFANKVSNFEDGVNFTIGEPDFATPANVKAAGINAITNNQTGYSHNAGLFSLRKKVTDFFYKRYHFYYNPENEVLITNGASQGIDSILRTILVEGDEVILPTPIYSGYESIVHLSGAKVIPLDTSDSGFIPDPAKMEAAITNNTKAIILNYPSNPTGTTMKKEQMEKLVSILKQHNIFIISDEIYSENTFSGDHTSFASFNEIREQLFLVHGLSKSHAMTGWRIGFVMGPENIIPQVLKVHLNNAICTSLPSQYAAMEALTNSQDNPATMNHSYMERRDYVYKRLLDLGFDVIKPTGAFYIFPSITSTGLSSMEFATKLLEQKHVAVVPGSAFGAGGEGFIRISYASSMETLEEGLNRMECFISER